VTAERQHATFDQVAPDELRRLAEVLHRVHKLVAGMSGLDSLLERIMEEGKAVAHAEAASLMLFDEERQELYFHVALGEQGDQQALKREVRLKLGQGLAGAAAAQREAVNVADVSSDDRFFADADALTHFQTRSILAVPLLDHDELIGVLEVLNKKTGDAFSEADLRVMEIFSSLAATAVSNARLIEENVRAERLAAIGEAVAGLSHFAKNIITGMGGSMDLIDQAVARGDAEAMSRAWPLVKRSMLRITSLVEDMLAYSKPREPLRIACRVDAVVTEAVDAYRETLARRGIDLTVDLTGLSGTAWLDPDQLLRCLLNLLSNAVEAVPSKGGHIWVGGREQPGGHVEVEVADNGPGIPEDIREKVLVPFFSTKGSQGTGLGLAVTAKVVQEHGGRIELVPREEGGTRVLLLFPRESKE
jgi:signal transduction histidine kinase